VRGYWTDGLQACGPGHCRLPQGLLFVWPSAFQLGHPVGWPRTFVFPPHGPRLCGLLTRLNRLQIGRATSGVVAAAPTS